jgi:hypothetical protein
MRQKKDWAAVKGDGTPGQGAAVVLQWAVDREQRERERTDRSQIFIATLGERAGKILKRKGKSQEKVTRVKRGKEKRR